MPEKSLLFMYLSSYTSSDFAANFLLIAIWENIVLRIQIHPSLRDNSTLCRVQVGFFPEFEKNIVTIIHGRS